MKQTANKIFTQFKQSWRHYILQSLLATLAIFATLLFLNINERPIIIASIGATTFIVFAMPKNVTAQAKNVIGGHLAGFFSGSLFSLISSSCVFDFALLCALAVGFSLFIMVSLNIEHPPAAGTALAIAVGGFSMDALIAVTSSAVILALARELLDPALRDLI